MNLYQQEMYRNSLKHGKEWKMHKYIRKEGNRYIYPEDIPKNDIQRHHAEVLADRRQAKETAKRDSAFLKRKNQVEDNFNRLYDIHPGSTSASNLVKAHQQIMKAHQNSTSANLKDPTHSSYTYWDTEKIYNDIKAARKKGQELDQINSAHQGSTKISARNKQDKTLTWKATNPEHAKKEIEQLRNRKNYGSEIESRKRSEEETRVRKRKAKDTIARTESGIEAARNRRNNKNSNNLPVGAKESDQIRSAHRGSTGVNYWNNFGDIRKPSEGAKSLNKQIEKTANRKKARETMARTEFGVTSGRRRKKKKASK